VCVVSCNREPVSPGEPQPAVGRGARAARRPPGDVYVVS
jgi:hypothetical protein